MDYHNAPFPPVFREAIESGLIKENPESPTKQFQDAIDREIHELDFLNWIRATIEQNLDEEKYARHCTFDNFKKYLANLNQAAAEALEKQKEKRFNDQYESGAFLPETRKDAYDLDLLENYQALSRAIKANPQLVRPEFDVPFFFKCLEREIGEVCKEKKWPLKAVLGREFLIPIPYDYPNYYIHLARKLMTCDLAKVGAVLSWHNSIYRGQPFFPSLVEHGIYSHIKHSSPFINEENRLQKLMDWVDVNRVFIASDELEELQKKRDEESLHLYHWRFTKEKLLQLYDALLKQGYISANADFLKCFTQKTVPPEIRTVWLRKQTELIYLFYLLNGCKWSGITHEPTHDALPRLFRLSEAELDSRRLNTKYSELLPTFNKPDELPKHLKAIHAIVDSLELSK